MTPSRNSQAKLRCAIYGRKSSDEGLDGEFTSLDAQRESATAYIASQQHEGWICLPEHYDDGASVLLGGRNRAHDAQKITRYQNVGK